MAQMTTEFVHANKKPENEGIWGRKDYEADLVQSFLQCLLENPLSRAQSIFSEALQITYLRT